MSSVTKPVRVRFAPSPTGRTHLGSGRTALYNYLLARQTDGKFILRIEDTDQKRYSAGAEDELIKSLNQLGLNWDEGVDVGGDYGPYRQTERKAIYQRYARQLIENGHAYICFCSPERLQTMREKQQKQSLNLRYDGKCRDISLKKSDHRVAAGESHVVRFKMPHAGSITVTDALRGEITVENSTLDDFILVKSDGLPVYHLAVVVDDHFMEISHVFRTSEWLPTFPLHGHLYQAFGWEQPVWVHPSIFLKPSGKGKMSKRDTDAMLKDGKSIFITDMLAMGYLPEAIINWTALIGWSYDDHTEFFTLDDLIEKFSIENLSPSPAAINFSKLDHFNGLHIRALEPADLAQRIKPYFEDAGYVVDDQDKLLQIAAVLQVRLVTLSEAPEKAGFFFQDNINPDPESLIGKKMTVAESFEVATQILALLKALPDFNDETINQPLRDLAASLGLKAGVVFGFLRNATTAQQVSPPIFETMTIIGREKTFERIEHAVSILKACISVDS
jgi:glutamyl-tRNA synthetase